MSSPVPPDQPDQGIHETTPDQGLHEQQPDQGLNQVPTPADAPAKSKAPLFVGIGALVVVVIGILAAIFH